MPPGIQSGDVLLAQVVVYDGLGTNLPAEPLGWTSIRHDSVANQSKITSWLYYKIAGASEPASYTWSLASQYAAGVMGAWRGASLASTIDNSSGATNAGMSPISDSAPSLTPSSNSELQVYFYGAQTSSAPTITESGAISSRSNFMSAKEGFTLAFGDLTAPPGGTTSLLYPATANFGSSILVLTAQAVLLRLGP
jgi:hypothetical protein